MAGATAKHAQRTKQPGIAGIRQTVTVQIEEPAAIGATCGLIELRTLRQRPADRMMAWPDVRGGHVAIACGTAIRRGVRQRRHAAKKNGQLQLRSYPLHCGHHFPHCMLHFTRRTAGAANRTALRGSAAVRGQDGPTRRLAQTAVLHDLTGSTVGLPANELSAWMELKHQHV